MSFDDTIVCLMMICDLTLSGLLFVHSYQFNMSMKNKFFFHQSQLTQRNYAWKQQAMKIKVLIKQPLPEKTDEDSDPPICHRKLLH